MGWLIALKVTFASVTLVSMDCPNRAQLKLTISSSVVWVTLAALAAVPLPEFVWLKAQRALNPPAPKRRPPPTPIMGGTAITRVQMMVAMSTDIRQADTNASKAIISPKSGFIVRVPLLVYSLLVYYTPDIIAPTPSCGWCWWTQQLPQGRP